MIYLIPILNKHETCNFVDNDLDNYLILILIRIFNLYFPTFTYLFCFNYKNRKIIGNVNLIDFRLIIIQCLMLFQMIIEL